MSDGIDLVNSAYSVSQLSRDLKRSVEDVFGEVRVQGEISDFKRASSGHCYFELKDSSASLKAIIWRSGGGKLSFPAEDGLEVVAVGRLTTYEKRSEYQLIVDYMELAGSGALLKLLQDRKRKLSAEGLFAVEHKLSLPLYPQVIGVITSPTGAVIQDILNRLSERMPVRVLLYPVSVQGDSASSQIVRAISDFNDGSRCLELGIDRPDLLIIARGGGSLQDLLPFSDELLVREAFRSKIPIISAIGHESDSVLLDDVSDYRCPTPTAAAVVAVRETVQVLDEVGVYYSSIRKHVGSIMRLSSSHLLGLGRGLLHPSHWLEVRQQRLDDCGEHLKKNMVSSLRGYGYIFGSVVLRFPEGDEFFASLRLRYGGVLVGRWQSLVTSMRYILERSEVRLRHSLQLLENGDYRTTLRRGFAIVRTRGGGDVGGGDMVACSHVSQLSAGSSINILFSDGDVDARVVGGKGGKGGKGVKVSPKSSSSVSGSGEGGLFD